MCLNGPGLSRCVNVHCDGRASWSRVGARLAPELPGQAPPTRHAELEEVSGLEKNSVAFIHLS